MNGPLGGVMLLLLGIFVGVLTISPDASTQVATFLQNMHGLGIEPISKAGVAAAASGATATGAVNPDLFPNIPTLPPFGAPAPNIPGPTDPSTPGALQTILGSTH